MKLTELFQTGKRTLSFEVFPPKTDTVFESVREATEAIARLHPDFMSVTYGAGGGTSSYTMQIAQEIEQKTGVPTIAHLTCVSSTRETVRARLADLTARGIQNVLALRGDLTPELMHADRSAWPYHHATDLIRDIRESGADLCIGGACYPEKHPESATAEDDLRHLKEKEDAGCSFLTTQMFFDNALYHDFVSRARAVGITVPILAGVMPITSVAQVERAVKLSGSYIPPRMAQMVARWGDSHADMRRAGIDYAAEQINDLYAGGVKNVHLYTMNKPDIAAEIRTLCGMDKAE